MGADEEGDGKFFLAIFDKLDAATLVDGHQSALGARKESNLVASQREISRGGAAAVTGTENCYLTDRHENRVLRIEPVVFEFVLIQLDAQARLGRDENITLGKIEGFGNDVILVINPGDAFFAFAFLA